MIIYNVTISLEKEIKDDWLKWMKNEHVPEVMKLGVFTKAQINKIISINQKMYPAEVCLLMTRKRGVKPRLVFESLFKKAFISL